MQVGTQGGGWITETFAVAQCRMDIVSLCLMQDWYRAGCGQKMWPVISSSNGFIKIYRCKTNDSRIVVHVTNWEPLCSCIKVGYSCQKQSQVLPLPQSHPLAESISDLNVRVMGLAAEILETLFQPDGCSQALRCFSSCQPQKIKQRYLDPGCGHLLSLDSRFGLVHFRA